MLMGNKNDLAATCDAVIRQAHTQRCGWSRSEDDCDMTFTNVEQWAMTKAAAGVRGGTTSRHLSDAKCSHYRSANPWAAANEFYVCGSVAEVRQSATDIKCVIQAGGIGLHNLFCVFLPGPAPNMRSDHDACRGCVP